MRRRSNSRRGGATIALGAALVLGCGGDGEARETAATNGIGSLSDTGMATMGDGGPGVDSMTGQVDGTVGGDATMGGGPGFDPKFDVASMPDIFTEEPGCTKVDFLFVIDNSGSMADEQANLINNFPAFITGIQSVLTQVDEYQVGVVTTDAYAYNQAVPGCNVLGGLVVQTGGGSSSNQVCGPYAAGGNYMTQADDLNTKFACAAQVGTSGNGYELTMTAMENVVNKVYGGPGQCNEGYLRDDALLVIVLITDEYDGAGDPEGSASAGDPMSWYNTVIAAKLGIPENAVALALVNYAGGPCPPGSTVFDGVNIVNFVNLFGENGFVGGVCEPDYGPVFMEAIGVIENACNNFIPPG